MDLHADIGAIWGAPDLDTGHKAVLTVVRYHADAEGNCRVTVDQIAEMASMHRASVIRRMADLVARKLIERHEDRRNGNVYRFTNDSWQPRQSSPTATTVVAHSDHSSRTLRPQKSHAATTVVAGSDHRTIEVVNCSHVATRRTTELQNKEQEQQQQQQHTRTHAHETSVDSGEVGGLIEAWWATQLGQGGRAPGFIVPPAVAHAVMALVEKHKAERVRWAITASVEKTNRGAPSIAFLRKLCEEGPLPERQDAKRTDPDDRRNGPGRPWLQAVHEPMKRSAIFDALGGKPSGTDE